MDALAERQELHQRQSTIMRSFKEWDSLSVQSLIVDSLVDI